MQADEDINDLMVNYERELRRRDRYEKKKDRLIGISYFGSEEEFGFSGAAYQQWLTEETRKRSYLALYEALEDLRGIDPPGHKLIIEYYFSGTKVTYTEIGKKYGISRQACTKKINNCLLMLKSLVNLHKNKV